jgi:hypothetical protein
VSRKPQGAFLIASLKRTDHYCHEHFPPEPQSRLPEGKPLEQIANKRLVIVEDTVQKCDSQARGLGAVHVRLSFN